MTTLQVIDNIDVTVPYGKISGKIWARKGDDITTVGPEKFIALHGWQDNCGTFDTLIPLINHRVVIVAIDFPGHGLSSHFPLGFPYTDLSYSADVKRVAEYLKWETFSLLGHSMGGYVSIYFSSLFPELVDRVISLDIVKPLTFSPDELAKSTSNAIKTFLEIDAKMSQARPAPTYTEEEAVTRLIEGHAKLGELSRESAAILLKRGSRPYSEDPTKVVFTRDPRLRAIFFTRLDTTTVRAYLKKVSCELLIVKAKDGISLDEDDVMNSFLDLYRENCKRFTYEMVDGNHHFHLCDPFNVAQAINRFLSGASATNGHQSTTNGCGSKNTSPKKAILKVDDIVAKPQE